MSANGLFLGVFGHWEILAIILIVIILFGSKKIPELFKGIGQGMKEFKKATKEEEEQNEKK